MTLICLMTEKEHLYDQGTPEFVGSYAVGRCWQLPECSRIVTGCKNHYVQLAVLLALCDKHELDDDNLSTAYFGALLRWIGSFASCLLMLLEQAASSVP